MVLSLLKFLNNICDTCVICKLISEFLEIKTHMYMLSHFSHFQLCGTLWTVACQAPSSWDSPGKNTGVGCHVLFQGIFPTQRLNPHLLCLLHWQVGSFTTSTTWEACTSIKQIKTNEQTGSGFPAWPLPLFLKTQYWELHVDGFHNPVGIAGCWDTFLNCWIWTFSTPRSHFVSQEFSY